MKDDLPLLGRPPVKRRQMEAALDLWIAQWLARDDLTYSERRRVEAEKARRRAVEPRVVVGFTGTRAGMTPAQKTRVRELVKDAIEAHHGDCVGADAQFHSICYSLKVPIVTHPPIETRLRARCQGASRSIEPKPFLDRNKDIVKAVSPRGFLIATPKESREPSPGRGQGTWSTIRYARTRDVTVKVVLPSGDLLGENNG